MKKITLLFAAVLCLNISFAQDSMTEEIEIVQNLFGAEKRTIIEQNINLEGVDSAAFWKVYDDYEASRKEIGKQKIELLQQYTTKEGAINNFQAEELLKKSISIRSAEDQAIFKAVKKLKKATSPLVASQFYQIEHYISDGIRFSILDNIDFIQDKE
jgi:hypothetical protein